MTQPEPAAWHADSVSLTDSPVPGAHLVADAAANPANNGHAHGEVASLANGAAIATPAAPVPVHPVGPLARLADFIGKTLTIAEWEVRKIAHDPTDILTRMVQPLLWILVFGETFSRVRAIPTGGFSYLDFMAPGILAQSVLFLSIFYGIAVIWERDLGVIHKFLASPTPRGALVMGKALSAGLRALPQAAIIYVIALLLGIHLSANPLSLVGAFLVVLLGAACFSTFSVLIACMLRSRERVMGIGQVLTMPLFFASNAIYPVAIMPGWLQVIARINPLSYMVDALRTLMLVGFASESGLPLDVGVLFLVGAVLIALAARMYPKLVQ